MPTPPASSVPEGYHTVTPYLRVSDPRLVLAFAGRAFGARVTEQLTAPDGSVMHAEMRVGDSLVMLGGAPDGSPPFPAMLYLYLPDVDDAYRRALDAGGTSLREPEDQFYGDRVGAVRDAGGNEWWLATRKETLSAEELARRVASAGG